MLARILVADDNVGMREMLATLFTDRGFSVETASNGIDAINMARETEFDVIITDLKMPGETGMGVLRASRQIRPDTKVIMISAYSTMENAIEAMRLGASDFIAKPFKPAEIEFKVDALLRERTTGGPVTHAEVQEKTGKTDAYPAVPPPVPVSLVGASPQMKQMLKMIEKIAPSRSSVLITGPTGTGKELVARAIHDASLRRERPFIALNCAALAPGILESELFGHEKGSFTGASERRIGRFERAHTGTLFLDEVGEIDPGIQTKLLRVLQTGEFERVGGAQTIKVDVRIVAATNRDLTEAIQQGRFREDFYYRLNVFSLSMQPLHNLPDDIPILVEHFIRKFSHELNKDITGVEPDVMQFLCNYAWPGNVRELENILERASVLAESNLITIDELPQELLFSQETVSAPHSHEPAPTAVTPAPAGHSSLNEQSDKLERELIRNALEKFHWNKSKAADHLGVKRTTLQYKIKKYGLE